MSRGEIDILTPSMICEACPAHKQYVRVSGLNRIEGRPIFVWAQNPGQVEAAKKLELVGPSGQMLWEELGRVGIERKDCDVQNVVRCHVIDDHHGRDRPPTAQEIKCCQKYNSLALGRNGYNAKLHLVLGKVAQRSLLGREYKQDRPVFESDVLNALVVCLDHPSYFLRGAPAHRLEMFRDRLRYAAKYLKGAADEERWKSAIQILTARDLRHVLDKLRAKKHRRVVVDIEDDGDLFLCVGLCQRIGQSHVVWLQHPKRRPEASELPRMFELLKEFFADRTVLKTFHWGCYDASRMEELAEIRTRGYAWDTYYAAYLADPGQKSYSLDTLSNTKYPEFAGYKDETAVTKGAQVHFSEVDPDVLLRRNVNDLELTKTIEQDTLRKISQPLMNVYIGAGFTLKQMESRGIWFDEIYSNSVREKVVRRLANIEKRLKKITGRDDFNPRSAPQVSEFVYDVLGLGDGSTRSTAKNTLSRLETEHPFPRLLQDHRALGKALSLSIDGYAEKARLRDGLLQTAWWLAGTAAGRLRSGGREGRVNFQNIHNALAILNQLVSDLGWRRLLGKYVGDAPAFVAFDYSQIELRMMAHMSQDPLLISQFRSGQNIHSLVGSEVTPWSFEEVTKDKLKRRIVKNFHFGIIYGLQRHNVHPYMVAKGVDVTPRECEDFYDAYFDRYKGVGKLIAKLQRKAEQLGYVETLFGFRRYVGEWEREEGRSTYWGNQAVNTPIQGTAHFLILIALCLLHLQPERFVLLQECVAEIHDSLIFYAPLRLLPEVHAQGKMLLEDAVQVIARKWFGIRFSIPILTECEVGFRLGTMVPYEGGAPKATLRAWREKYEQISQEDEIAGLRRVA